LGGAAAYGAVGAVAGDGEGEDGGARGGGRRGGGEALLDDGADEAGGGRCRGGGGGGWRRGVEGLLHDLAARRVGAAGLVPPLRRRVHRGGDGSGALRDAVISEEGLRGGLICLQFASVVCWGVATSVARQSGELRSKAEVKFDVYR